MNEKLLAPLIATATISVVLSAACSYFLVTSHIEAAMSEVPQFAIAGYKRIEESMPLEVAREDLGRAYEDMNRKIEMLSDNGYLILDERIVLSAPQSYYVPIMELKPSPASMERDASFTRPAGMDMEDLRPQSDEVDRQVGEVNNAVKTLGFPPLFND